MPKLETQNLRSSMGVLPLVLGHIPQPPHAVSVTEFEAAEICRTSEYETRKLQEKRQSVQGDSEKKPYGYMYGSAFLSETQCPAWSV